MTEKIAITGLSGLIGRQFIKRLPKNVQIIDLYHNIPAKENGFGHMEHVKLDLGKPSEVYKILREIKPTGIIHLAAVTHVDRCEEDRGKGKSGLTWRINVMGTEAIAKAAASIGAFMVFYSTECVFDGKRGNFRENDAVNPKNWYGITKAEAEMRVHKYCENSAIIRGVITYSENGGDGTPLGIIVNRLRRGLIVQGVTDQIITPTYTPDLVDGGMIVLRRRIKGIFHIVPRKKTTPFEFAKKIAQTYKFDEGLIKPTTMIEFFGRKRATLRLKNSCLDGDMTERVLDYHPRTIDDVFDRISR